MHWRLLSTLTGKMNDYLSSLELNLRKWGIGAIVISFRAFKLFIQQKHVKKERGRKYKRQHFTNKLFVPRYFKRTNHLYFQILFQNLV